VEKNETGGKLWERKDNRWKAVGKISSKRKGLRKRSVAGVKLSGKVTVTGGKLRERNGCKWKVVGKER
jgi:hypothetical protein